MVAVVLLPRDRAEFPALPSIPFDQPGDYDFKFRLPRSREVTVLLAVENFKVKGEPGRLLLTQLKTIIEVKLINHAGRIVCQVASVPGDGVGDDHWVLKSGGGEAAFWHRGCAEIKLKRSESYTLKLRIRDVDPKTPKVRLTPMFERSDDYGP